MQPNETNQFLISLYVTFQLAIIVVETIFTALITFKMPTILLVLILIFVNDTYCIAVQPLPPVTNTFGLLPSTACTDQNNTRTCTCASNFTLSSLPVTNSVSGLLFSTVCSNQNNNGYCTCASSSTSSSLPVSDSRNINLTTPELVEKYNYPIETHNITTADGYIITNHRIPNPGKPVVFLYHGILCSSRDWFMQNNFENTLPIQLYKKGYDVWIGNIRGNGYSVGHTGGLTINDRAYWNFSVDAISLNDVPAIIDYITNKTNRAQINWVGHSLGTSTLFSALINKPEYQSKIRCFAGLAPVTVTTHYRDNPVWGLLATQTNPEEPLKGSLYDISEHGEFFPEYLSNWIHTYAPLLCTADLDRPNICGNILSLFTGFNEAQLDNKMQSVIFGGFPSSISIRTLIQQVQGIIFGANKFRLYNYQLCTTNIDAYGIKCPPEMNLANFKVPTMLFGGLNDALAPPADVAWAYNILKEFNKTTFYQVQNADWSHLDFLFGKDACYYVYRELLDTLETCNGTLT